MNSQDPMTTSPTPNGAQQGTPRTDRHTISVIVDGPVHKNHYTVTVNPSVPGSGRYVEADFARTLELELATLRAENERLQDRIDNLEAATIHTCHEHCQRPMCVLRRERDALASQLRTQLASALAAGREDRETLDWLEDECHSIEWGDDCVGVIKGATGESFFGKTLRAAIAAARQPKPSATKEGA